MSEQCDYELSTADANLLMGITLVPDELRQKLLEQLMSTHGRYGLIRLFYAFIGMANSVVANTRTFIEDYLVIECGHYQQTAEKINLMTI